MRYGENFQANVASRGVKPHAKEELPDDEPLSDDLRSLQAEIGRKHLKTTELDKRNSNKQLKALAAVGNVAASIAAIGLVLGVMIEFGPLLFVATMITGATGMLTMGRACFVAGRVPHKRKAQPWYFIVSVACLFICFLARHYSM